MDPDAVASAALAARLAVHAAANSVVYATVPRDDRVWHHYRAHEEYRVPAAEAAAIDMLARRMLETMQQHQLDLIASPTITRGHDPVTGTMLLFADVWMLAAQQPAAQPGP